MTVRITEAELASDLHAVLARVREGDEVIVEQDYRPVALIKAPPPGPGRKLSECIALAKAMKKSWDMRLYRIRTSKTMCRRPSMPAVSCSIRRNGI